MLPLMCVSSIFQICWTKRRFDVSATLVASFSLVPTMAHRVVGGTRQQRKEVLDAQLAASARERPDDGFGTDEQPAKSQRREVGDHAPSDVDIAAYRYHMKRTFLNNKLSAVDLREDAELAGQAGEVGGGDFAAVGINGKYLGISTEISFQQ